ncbi:MAG: DNA polymerase III subunit beta [Anaerolineaceae bacterium]|jgi:DNA polymerase-3 subunit beta|nr:DNA polymerase III subunit beta [Anaerolineaceae bacterium]
MTVKIDVSKNVLKSALADVMKSIGYASNIPIITTVLVSIEGQQLRLATTDLSMTSIKWIPLASMAFEQAAIAIPGKVFTDLVTIAPAGEISLEIDTKTQEVEISVGGTFKNKLKCLDAKEFPPLPVKPDHTTTVLPAGAWKTIAERVAVSAHSKEDGRPVLTGVSLEFEKESFRAVATDGFRLSVQEFNDVKPGVDTKVLVPASSFIKAAPALGDENAVQILSDSGRLIAFTEDSLVAFQLIEGHFPDWKAIIPASFKNKNVVSTAELEQATKQALVIARSSNQKFAISYAAAGNALIVIGDDEAGSKCEANMPSETAANTFFTLNGVFVLQALVATKDAKKLIIRSNNSNTPVQVSSEEVPGYTGILMPMSQGVANDQEKADELKALALQASVAMGMDPA